MIENFDFEEYVKNTEKIEELLKDVPTEWKADVTRFIITHLAVISTNNIFEGIGIIELAKVDYIEICDNVDEDKSDIYLN
jgi:predicted transglutaminase-like protease